MYELIGTLLSIAGKVTINKGSEMYMIQFQKLESSYGEEGVVLASVGGNYRRKGSGIESSRKEPLL